MGSRCLRPPAVKTDPVVDEYKSTDPNLPTKVTDPYRWLEDAHSPETRAYIAAQNAYTAQYFSQVKMLPEVVDQMGKLLKTDFVRVPTQRGDRYFFSKRLADENQASIYMRVGLHGADEKLIDAAEAECGPEHFGEYDEHHRGRFDDGVWRARGRRG